MVKVISLANDAYAELKVLKKEDDSFSDVVRRLVKKEKKADIMDFFGIWSDDEADFFMKTVKEGRKRARGREARF